MTVPDVVAFLVEYIIGVPVVADARAEETELRMDIVPGEADLLPLYGRERGVEGLSERLGGARRGRLGGGRSSRSGNLS